MKKTLRLLAITTLVIGMTTSADALSIRLSHCADDVTVYDNAPGDSEPTHFTGAFPGFEATMAVQAMEIAHPASAEAGLTGFDKPLTPVPEPRTFLLLGVGLMGVGIYGRCKNQK